MTLGVARITDLYAGICCCHPVCIGMVGIIITGDTTVNTNNLPTARLTDIVIGLCGHIGIIVTSSNVTYSSNLGVARLTDAVAGCLIGIVVTSSTDTFTS